MVALEAFAIAGVLVFVLVFAVYLLAVRDAREAARRTSNRFVGISTGAGGAAAAIAVVGLEVVAQLPEIAIAILGIGAIITGISWEMFAATAVVVYVLTEAINGAPRSA